MLHRLPALAVLIPLVFSAAAPGQIGSEKNPVSFSLFPSLWFAEMKKGELEISDSVGTGPILGQEVDLIDDLGVREGPNTFPGFRAVLGYRGSLFLRGGYQELNFRGGNRTDRPIRFAGYTVPAGTDVDTSTSFDFFEVGLQYNIINTQDFRLGFLLEPKFMNLRIRVSGEGQEGTSGPLVPFYEKEEEFVVMPLLGLHLDVRPFQVLGFRGEIKGLSLPDTSIFGFDGDYRAVDMEIAASLYLADSLALSAGYRWFRFDLEWDDSNRDIELGMEFEGWFASLDLRF